MMTWQTSQTDPKVLQEIIAHPKITLLLQMTPSLFQFQGHFPDEPILPGVAQLDWAVRYAKYYFDTSLSVQDISQLKFRRFISPDMEMSLILDYDQPNSSILFKYQDENEEFSSGRIRLGKI